jgi:hypothetical protein
VAAVPQFAVGMPYANAVTFLCDMFYGDVLAFVTAEVCGYRPADSESGGHRMSKQ